MAEDRIADPREAIRAALNELISEQFLPGEREAGVTEWESSTAFVRVEEWTERIAERIGANDDAPAQLNAIERRLADDRANLRPECAGMSTADLVKAALDRREEAIDQGWAYAGVVEGEGAADRKDRDAEIERLNGLIARLLPHVNHSEAAGCPMAFHRSDGEQCTCGALDAVREAREPVPEVAS